MEDKFDFEMNDWFEPYKPMTPEEEAITDQEEKEMFLGCCGSCSNFISLMAEAGLCKLNPPVCFCKTPMAFIDMFDEKCEKWVQES